MILLRMELGGLLSFLFFFIFFPSFKTVCHGSFHYFNSTISAPFVASKYNLF